MLNCAWVNSFLNSPKHLFKKEALFLFSKATAAFNLAHSHAARPLEFNLACQYQLTKPTISQSSLHLSRQFGSNNKNPYTHTRNVIWLPRNSDSPMLLRQCLSPMVAAGAPCCSSHPSALPACPQLWPQIGLLLLSTWFSWAAVQLSKPSYDALGLT